ncbi:hypothetical protein ACRALDRAFT_1062455 [Sodiomyces alcalophilus JCM 7366]|uniref:uncharacterized protein n=1 Tax=Sodiomyces alcalophilus JCM 7366 TaxID=591952 RepID=UPI0039B5BB19
MTTSSKSSASRATNSTLSLPSLSSPFHKFSNPPAVVKPGKRSHASNPSSEGTQASARERDKDPTSKQTIPFLPEQYEGRVAEAHQGKRHGGAQEPGREVYKRAYTEGGRVLGWADSRATIRRVVSCSAEEPKTGNKRNKESRKGRSPRRETSQCYALLGGH